MMNTISLLTETPRPAGQFPARRFSDRVRFAPSGREGLDVLAGSNLLSLHKLSRKSIDSLFDLAATMDACLAERRVAPVLKGFMLANLFFQPSTRTRFGFEAAINRLGGTVMSCASVAETRSGTEAAGWVTESMADMARVISGMADIAVLRHPTIDAVHEFSRHASVPVVNAGNGMGKGAEHPTQALIDLYTIYKEFRHIDGLSILVAGSLQFRVAHSLLTALARFEGVTLYLLCPDEYWWTPEEDAALRAIGARYTRIESIDEVVDRIDVLYHNGLDELKFDVLPHGYTVDLQVLERASDRMIVMHPLPRDIEIPSEIDATPHARYFEQVRNGIPLRMAVLTALLGRADRRIRDD
jgi:aspartate carbamoyltransferase catalytic subunit